jgi:hypothetical protein
MARIAIDLHKMSYTTNVAIPVLTAGFLLLGVFQSFYFHFGTIAFLFLTIINTYYLFGQKKHALLRNFRIMSQMRYSLTFGEERGIEHTYTISKLRQLQKDIEAQQLKAHA